MGLHWKENRTGGTTTNVIWVKINVGGFCSHGFHFPTALRRLTRTNFHVNGPALVSPPAILIRPPIRSEQHQGGNAGAEPTAPVGMSRDAGVACPDGETLLQLCHRSAALIVLEV